MNSKQKFLQKKGVVCLLAMVCCGLWGSAVPSIKIGSSLLNIHADDTASVILFAGCRFMLAGVLTVVMTSLFRRKFVRPTRRTLPKIGLIALFQTVLQYFFYYVGLLHTTGIKCSIINSTFVFFCLILSGICFRQDRLTGWKIAGCLIGFAGVVLVNANGAGMNLQFSFLGEGFVLLSSMAYAGSVVLMKKFSENEDLLMLSGYQFFAGGAVMALGGLAAGGRFTVFPLTGALVLLYLAFISAVAYGLWGILLKYNPVSTVSIFGFMTPCFGVLLSAIFLHEGNTLSWLVGVALVLVCAGIALVNRPDSRPKAE